MKSLSKRFNAMVTNKDLYVPSEERKKRLEICAPCENLSKKGVCELCLCPVKDKAKYATEVCDESKWPGDKEKMEAWYSTDDDG